MAGPRTVDSHLYELAPFGVVDGQRLPCPATVDLACRFCGRRFAVPATQTGEPCLCGGPVERVENDDDERTD